MSTPEYEARREAALADGAHHRLANTVRRFSHGSRVPGWDDAVDLDKDAAAIPEPATTPVPEDLRAALSLGLAPGAGRRAARARLVLARGHRPGRLRHAADARLPRGPLDLL